MICTYDIETLSNLFTYTAKDRETGEIFQFTIWNNQNQLPELLKHLCSVKGLIGFNNLNFDYPVLHYILNEYESWNDKSSDYITKKIYNEAQETIAKEFSNIRDEYIKIPQLDIFRIWHYDNKARMTSLKKLQIAFRTENVQDMPYHHSETIDTYEQVQEILDYNLHDVVETEKFYLKTISKINLRKELYDKYKLKCMNYPDSKIGEELTLKLYCKATNKDYDKVKKLRTHRSKFVFKECFPHYMKFETEPFKDVVKYLSGIVVNELKDSFKYSFEYNGFTFDLGTGGIHGCIKAGVYESDDKYILVDIDVSSLYPNLAIVNDLYPEHLGEEFLTVYQNEIILPRLEAKKNGDTVLANGFKLSANSVFGKSNSSYSALYDPLYTLKTTLAGQLSLLMLSEKLMTRVKDLTMLQINTDGISVRIPISEKRNFYNLCKEWEKETKLSLEYVGYKKMVIRDVNNYIAITTTDKVKLKGIFKTYDTLIKDEEYHKSFSQLIVPEALYHFYLNNVPLEVTILNHKNIYDFCKSFNASKGWVCETHDKLDDMVFNVIPQQKNNRYYISKNGKTFVKKEGDRVIEIEAGGKKVTMFNQYIDKPIEDYDIDYQYYIDECYKITDVIDGTEEKRLIEAKRIREETKLKKEEDRFIQYCVDRVPTLRQYELYKRDWLINKYGERKTK